ncbi:MAG: glycosyltransferase family 2 protein [Synergistaceae bacterium]|nr:glycosyltransferase family 2 protein [Synergistaceae bacterium]
MATVDVLLAAYNGEKYIREQIDSILGQTFRDFRLLIRDDGSKDATPEIIGEYEGRYPGVVKAVSDDEPHGGAAINFFQLMKHAEADYMMFADQDDYWLPDKIQVSLDGIRELEARTGRDRPALVFPDYTVVDAALKPITVKNKNLQVTETRNALTLNKLLVQNYVTGCLIMANRSLYKAMGDYAEGVVMHDWWVALYAQTCGTLRHIPKVVMFYRQHGDNCIGAKDANRFKYYWGKFMDPATKDVQKDYCRQALLFRKRYGGELDEDALKTLDNFIALYDCKSKLGRVRALLKGGYLKSDWARILGQIAYI